MVTGLPHRIEGPIQTQILKEVPYPLSFAVPAKDGKILRQAFRDFVFCCPAAYSAELF